LVTIVGVPCVRPDAWPVRKSARPRPVSDPLNAKLPAAFAKSRESTVA
jgi:hypothetical protein